MSRYVCGFDFGTLSCRISVRNLATGESVFEESMDYPHGVISEQLNGIPLPPGWALQDPADYLEVMIALTHQATCQIDPRMIAAIGTDFTNCTVVPIGSDGRPLCDQEAYRRRPHAWAKLWKHHSAQPQADRMKSILIEKKISWFDHYGYNVSSEWLFPKLLQIFEEDREVFEAADCFLEAADYIVYILTGRITRNLSTLGVNAFYSSTQGYPDSMLLEAFSEGFGSVLQKLGGRALPVGTRAGTITKNIAALLGLPENVVIAAGHGDSEIVAAGLGITEPGIMLMVMGTSTCYQMLHTEDIPFKGICSVVKGGMLPGLFAYESGQPAVGDMFAWFANNQLPERYLREAQALGFSPLQYLSRLCGGIRPGASGLIALDWFNGNRSVLMNYDLRGCILGLSLQTKPEDVYLSLVEATAFGARRIFQSYSDAGIPISKMIAVGGLAQKSAEIIQLYADILGRAILVPSIDNASSMGGCVCAAVALEYPRASIQSFSQVCARMVRCDGRTIEPNPEHSEIYNRLYGIYTELHDYFGVRSSACDNLKSIAYGRS